MASDANVISALEGEVDRKANDVADNSVGTTKREERDDEVARAASDHRRRLANASRTNNVRSAPVRDWLVDGSDGEGHQWPEAHTSSDLPVVSDNNQGDEVEQEMLADKRSQLSVLASMFKDESILGGHVHPQDNAEDHWSNVVRYDPERQEDGHKDDDAPGASAHVDLSSAWTSLWSLEERSRKPVDALFSDSVTTPDKDEEADRHVPIRSRSSPAVLGKTGCGPEVFGSGISVPTHRIQPSAAGEVSGEQSPSCVRVQTEGQGAGRCWTCETLPRTGIVAVKFKSIPCCRIALREGLGSEDTPQRCLKHRFPASTRLRYRGSGALGTPQYI
ncbi:unnamed protein product (mitochondrion) [Plasmodiophora brassicae]|uniref:Uncharacterized protein n=1 Tax=Plasmodiophora brassicae TaxID=37360 RepID=A0A3P3YJM8_PLABS|nr:unnamed protein product [Plasmodiophora brassicae]